MYVCMYELKGGRQDKASNKAFGELEALLHSAQAAWPLP